MAICRWHSYVAALVAALSCGFLYTFSTFSGALQAAFDLSEPELATIAMGQTVSGLVTFANGQLADRVGARVAVVFGGVVSSMSWLAFGAVAVGRLPVSEHVAVFTVLSCLASWGAAFTTAGVFSVIAKNFSDDRAVALGTAKAWVGVAGGLATAIFVGFHPSSDNDPRRLSFLWFLSLVCALTTFLSAPFLQVFDRSRSGHVKDEDDLLVPHRWRLLYTMAVTVTLIVVIASAALTRDTISASSGAWVSCAIISIMLLPTALLWPAQLCRESPHVPGAQEASLLKDHHVIDDPGATNVDRDCPVVPCLPGDKSCGGLSNGPASPWEGGPATMLRQPSSWAIWFITFSLMSGGVFLTANLQLMCDSRSGPRVSAATMVTLFSCAQGFGRLFGGHLSDEVVRRRAGRPWCWVALTLCMAAAHSCLCLPGPHALCIGVVLAGCAFGLQYPVLIVSVAELFGAERVASNYMVFDGAPCAMGTILIAKALAQHVYQTQAGPEGGGVCDGDTCFRLSHAAIIMLQLAAGLVAVCLAMRTQQIYQALGAE